jgi:hypothetical protein
MTWYFQNQAVTEIPDGVIGFVYLITNLTSDRKYIGKKLMLFKKTTYKMVKLKNGTKKRKKIRGLVDSDWKDYYGSSVELSKDIANLGKQNFSREILFFCRTRAECSYIEAREQFSRRVLESTDYYNGQISVKVHGSHILKKFPLNE